MADRHAHRHGGAARSHAHPYGGRVSGGHSGQPAAATGERATHTRVPTNTRAPRTPRTADAEEDVDSDTYDPRKPHALERDPHRLEQRQKQIDMGKSTPEYKAYLEAVPTVRRVYDLRFESHPLTPNKHHACSKRSWDGQVRKWRRLLHQYDGAAKTNVPPGEDGDDVKTTPATMSTHSAAPPQLLPAPLNSPPQPAARNDQATSDTLSLPATIAAVPSPPLAAAPLASIAPPSISAPMADQPAVTADAASAPRTLAQTSVLFTSSVTAPTVYDDRLGTFDEDELALMPQTAIDAPSSAALDIAAALIPDEELVDYEEDDEEMEMRQQALDAARQL